MKFWIKLPSYNEMKHTVLDTYKAGNQMVPWLSELYIFHPAATQ